MAERITGAHVALAPPAREAADDAGAPEDLPDLQTLLAGAVERLGERTGAARASAWALRPAGGGFVAAAWSRDGESPRAPDAAALAAASALAGPSDLGAGGVPDALAAFARAHDLSAAAPIRARDARAPAAAPGAEGDRPLAILLLGGPDDPPGAVRPRTLAALEEAARRLRPSAETAAAVTRLGRLDDAVRRVDRLASLGDLLAEIAHEVRNPLVSVKTFLQLLPDRIEDEEFRTHFLSVVADELRRVERLLDLVLEHARPGSPDEGSLREGSRTPVAGVLDAVRRLLTHRAQERGITLRVEAEPALREARIAPDALRQVVLNLAMNALDANEQGGEVVLRARSAQAGVARIEVDVEDHGPGIPVEVRPRVFEPFFSTKPGRPGGLGLAICRRIAEECGGSIAVDEGRRGGAVFRVTLPVA